MTDILIDTGPIVAVLDANDDLHAACVEVIEFLDCPFYTTMAVLTEAMHLLGRRSGWRGQAALWELVRREDFLVQHPTRPDLERMAELMDKYRDRPMDFADASLVVLAENLSLRRIFTTDRADFSTYRIAGKHAFVILGP